ncbi:MAG: methionine--tRNA ligase [Candidatus Pacebacteria bacterium]|nr:methionine--tRNA ligase [Candidatus Paceibacterota bacterium]
MGNTDKKIYITTSIPYVNDVPHIGHALEFVQADVIARYYRQQGHNVFFMTGSDEHGTKIEKTAQKVGITPKKLVDKNSKAFKDLKKTLNIAWNQFIRTTDKKNHLPGVQKMWAALAESGDLYKRTYHGLYCAGCEAFVTDKDLIDGKCAIHCKEPELIQEENWFFRLSAYTKTLKNKIKEKELEIIPESKANEILSLMEKGLEDVSFSRSAQKLKWGIAVPEDATQTMYVWADALTNYISGIGYGRDEEEFNKWWPAYVHVIGKDILRFHAAIWPAMLLSAKLPLPKKLLVHGHINVNGQKMSKSLGNVISPVDLVSRYGTDAVRHYLIREIATTEDGDYSEEKFKNRYNADLANGLGNFIARVVGMISKRHYPVNNDHRMMDLIVENKIKTTAQAIDEHINTFHLNDAVNTLWNLIAFGDMYINEKKPWDEKHSLIENEKTLYNLAVIANAVGVLLTPFLPDTAKKIGNSITLKGKIVSVKKGTNLFPRLE